MSKMALDNYHQSKKAKEQGSKLFPSRSMMNASRGGGGRRAGAEQPKNKCILIIGGPASGKGTQCEKIKNKFQFVYER